MYRVPGCTGECPKSCVCGAGSCSRESLPDSAVWVAETVGTKRPEPRAGGLRLYFVFAMIASRPSDGAAVYRIIFLCGLGDSHAGLNAGPASPTSLLFNIPVGVSQKAFFRLTRNYSPRSRRSLHPARRDKGAPSRALS